MLAINPDAAGNEFLWAPEKLASFAAQAVAQPAPPGSSQPPEESRPRDGVALPPLPTGTALEGGSAGAAATLVAGGGRACPVVSLLRWALSAASR